MANVINRTTLEYLRQVNTPDYPIAEWIINPKLPKDVPEKYWKIVGDDVVEMDAQEKAVVDNTDLAKAKTTRISLMNSDADMDILVLARTAKNWADMSPTQDKYIFKCAEINAASSVAQVNSISWN